ncbi:MAG: alkaline phosphatase D family protein [Bryobacteraceae bacterium]
MRNLLILALAAASAPAAAEFQSAFPAHTERVWAGPEYWANPLQDWRVANGRLECAVSGANRNVNLLTHQLGKSAAAFSMSVRLGAPAGRLEAGWAGFRIGISGPIDDYRYAAIHGRGLDAGITTAGKTFIGEKQLAAALAAGGASATLDDLELRLTAAPGQGGTRLLLAALKSGREISQAVETVPSERLAGNVALVSDWIGEAARKPRARRQGDARGGNLRFWFRDWRLSGPRVEAHPEQAWGPILWSQYTISKGVLKLTAQMPPLGVEDSQTVQLQVREGAAWKTIDTEQVHTLAYTATFRIAGWDASRDVPYRLVYDYRRPDGKTVQHYWTGTFRRDPVDKPSIVVAGFTGNQDTGFPNTPTVNNIRFHDPDLLFFSGDQIYENVAGYGIQREPIRTAALDYLRKWFLFGWAFGGLMRDRPAVHLPDDHDVYQGNIWGAGGRKVAQQEHERGGYVMPAEWVNMVQRTQTSHLPDAYDPRPAEQGITVYYTELLWGRISFGILEDRKFKSGPKGITPETGGRADHITDPKFDRAAYDPPGATILGDRQLAFVRDWTADWRGADFKVALSQTMFAGVPTNHGAGFMRLVGDMDSNGWPHSGRDQAVREIRKGYAFLYAGDTHLPTLVHLGVEDWNDSGWSFAVPSIAAGYPRLFEPDAPGRNRQPGMPDYTGEHLDAFGNRMTVWAVANPKKEWREHPYELLMDKASGYGIVRFDKPGGKITIECWPILVDASQPGAASRQFPGWPKTVGIEDNFAKKGEAWLPRLRVQGMRNPVVQVVEETTGEHIYTLRVRGAEYQPRVFARTGVYTVKVGEPGRDFRVFTGLKPETRERAGSLDVRFGP